MWVVNLYSQWRAATVSVVGCPPQIINANLDSFVFSKQDLCYVMCRFICEVKKIDGTEYPPNNVRDLVLMVQMYLHKNSMFWKLLDNVEFTELRNVLDNTMKERHGSGLGVRKSSYIITLDHENKMFNQGVLGDENAAQLLRTVIYMVGLHCTLRGGVEHSNLRRPGCNSQLTFERDTRGIEHLVYREDPLHKTNQGGLSSKGSAKIVHVYPSANSRKCPEMIIKKYMGVLPQSKKCQRLYLRCKKIPTPITWYCNQPFWVNKIKSTVKEMCKMAGLDGNLTYHSLRASCASRMYENNVPKQIIKETTGHRSECVHVYKRTSETLREATSKTLTENRAPKVVEIEQNSSDEETVKMLIILLMKRCWKMSKKLRRRCERNCSKPKE